MQENSAGLIILKMKSDLTIQRMEHLYMTSRVLIIIIFSFATLKNAQKKVPYILKDPMKYLP